MLGPKGNPTDQPPAGWPPGSPGPAGPVCPPEGVGRQAGSERPSQVQETKAGPGLTFHTFNSPDHLCLSYLPHPSVLCARGCFSQVALPHCVPLGSPHASFPSTCPRPPLSFPLWHQASWKSRDPWGPPGFAPPPGWGWGRGRRGTSWGRGEVPPARGGGSGVSVAGLLRVTRPLSGVTFLLVERDKSTIKNYKEAAGSWAKVKAYIYM